MLLSEDEIEIGPLLVNHLVEEGKIERPEFSFAMYGMDTDTSYVDFGAPDGKRVAGGLSSMIPIPMFEDFFWASVWQAVSFDGVKSGAGYSVSDYYTILDTGSSHMFLPPSLFEPFVLEMMAQAGDPEFLVQ
jgi:hypothetical protein